MDSLEKAPLSSDILAAVAILNRGAESVRAVMTTDENRFSRALADLQKLVTAENIPIAIVGGLGAIRYGYPAATQDIDIAVARNQLETLLQVAPRYGFKIQSEAPSGWHTLRHGDVDINVVPEGGVRQRTLRPRQFPAPRS